MGKEKNSRSGFTRGDLLVVVGCICLLAAVWIRPSLASSAARSDEAVCANNLRHIGQAFSQWTQDHGETYAWWLPTGSPEATKSYPWHPNLWFQYFWVSNELRSPRYLTDPADDWPSLRTATNWSDEPGGFVHVGSRNNAVSYFLGLHGTPLQPRSVLAGDGNLQGGPVEACSTGINAMGILRANALWPDNVHHNQGNLLFGDGAVEMTDSGRLDDVVTWAGTGMGIFRGNWNTHFLKPHLP